MTVKGQEDDDREKEKGGAATMGDNAMFKCSTLSLPAIRYGCGHGFCPATYLRRLETGNPTSPLGVGGSAFQRFHPPSSSPSGSGSNAPPHTPTSPHHPHSLPREEGGSRRRKRLSETTLAERRVIMWLPASGGHIGAQLEPLGATRRPLGGHIGATLGSCLALSELN